MNILIAATLVAYSIFDALPQSEPPRTPPTIAYSPTGKGDLLIQAGDPVSIGSIPRGANRVFMGQLLLSATCEADIKIDSIDITHTGLGSVSDIQAVYLADARRRVSRTSRFDSRRGIASVRMMSFTIPKCEAATLGIYVDVSQDAAVGSEHGAKIAMPTSVVSSAKKTTLVSIDLSSHTYTTPYRAGTISVNFLPVHGYLRFGRVETVARIQLSADAKGSHILQKISLTNTEMAHDMDLVNFRIENTRGELLSGPATRMHGDKVTIEFSPTYPLSRSTSVVLLVKAEIRASQRRGVNFILEEPSDLVSIPGPTR